MTRPAGAPAQELRHRPLAGLLLTLAAAALIGVGMAAVPREGDPLPAIARRAIAVAIPRWHTTEVVNEIVYGTRGFDTFGETFLLLAAVVGIATICRGRERRAGLRREDEEAEEERRDVGRRGGPRRSGEPGAASAEEGERTEAGGPGPPPPGGRTGGSGDDEPLGTAGKERAPAMTLVVRGGIRAVIPVLAVAGVYLAAWGYSPGGGFPAGAVLAGVVLLAYAAFGPRSVRRLVHADLLEAVELVGASVIVAVGVLGLVASGSFSANWLPLGAEKTIAGGGILQVFSGGELIEVATGLLLAIFSLLTMAGDWSSEAGQAGDGR